MVENENAAPVRKRGRPRKEQVAARGEAGTVKFSYRKRADSGQVKKLKTLEQRIALGLQQTNTIFEPTQEQRDTVFTLSGYGCTQNYIASKILWGDGTPISLETLQAAFAYELLHGREDIRCKLVRAVLEKALIEKNLSAMKFCLEKIGNTEWREVRIDDNKDAAKAQVEAIAIAVQAALAPTHAV